MRKIRKVVIPVAGFGTRMLPYTKVIPKEMLPVYNKPVIQYAAEEAVAAGIETLIFVTSKHKKSIEDHFDRHFELEQVLEKNNKKVELDQIKNILPKSVNLIFLRQQEQLGLGHAILVAKEAVGNEPFAVILPDDFIYRPEGSEIGDLIDAYNKTGKYHISSLEVEGPQISRFGVIKEGEEPGAVSKLIEKPPYIDAPSKIASIGRYLLPGDIFDLLKDQEVGFGGEIQLADAINALSQSGIIYHRPLTGRRFDCGNMDEYIQAVNIVSKDRVRS